jgi:ParB family transcriptional regulator, chromosome partitioning protein
MNARETGPRLGRGLAALLGDMAVQAPAPAPGAVRQLPLDMLEPNPFQPRTAIDLEALQELTDSIRVRGILQPLLVRPKPDDPARYQIVAGERRWRAAGAAGLHEVPVLVRETTDGDAAAAALVENLQRQDLDPVDEARGYARLLDQFGLTPEALGQAVGKSRSHVANTLRLLALPEPALDALRGGIITAGHGRALLAHPDPEAGLRDVIARQLSVRQTEALATRAQTVDREPQQDPDTRALERTLTERLGLRVRITPSGNGGTVRITYSDLDQLDGLIERLTATGPD